MSSVDTIRKVFPNAMTGTQFTREVIELFAKKGFTPENTVFATSTCPDEINRAVTGFAGHYGEHFIMGGLAGFPFTGITGFGALSHHVPDNGYLFILYGPHIGVSAVGELGKVKRPGMGERTASCGSLCGAYNYLKPRWTGIEDINLTYDRLDPQQWYVTSRVHQCRNVLEWSDDPMHALVETAFGAIDEDIQAIFHASRTHYTGTVAFIGGIQINTPPGEENYFSPKRIELFDFRSGERTDLLSEIIGQQKEIK